MWNYLNALGFLLERDTTKRIVLYSETRGCVCYGIWYVSRDRYGVAIRIGKYYTSGIVNSPLKLGRNLQIKESLIVWSSLCRYYIWKTHWGTMNCHFYKYIFCWVCLLWRHFNFKIIGIVSVETQKVKYERRHHTPFNPYFGEKNDSHRNWWSILKKD